VYLPPGTWIDYQTARVYEGARWHEIAAGQIPIVLLVRNHAVIPHAALAQSTAEIDWRRLELRVFSTDDAAATGEVTLGEGGDVRTVRVVNGRVVDDPLAGSVAWRVTRVPLR
jgi:alpha-D-xyloside xylohydrolase